MKFKRTDTEETYFDNKKIKENTKNCGRWRKKTLFPWHGEWCGNGNVSKSELINLKCLENLSVKIKFL